jgi:hypothetical protein
MLDDTTKLLLGPVLALVPVVIWELVLRPSRTRRNLALLLIAEIELNLEEVAYCQAVREEATGSFVGAPLLPRGSFTASQGSLGELPPPDVRALLRFYATTARLEAAYVSLAAALARLEHTTVSQDVEQLNQLIAANLRTIGVFLDDAWRIGADTREALDELVRTGWIDAPPVIKDASTIRIAARARRAIQVGGA